MTRTFWLGTIGLGVCIGLGLAVALAVGTQRPQAANQSRPVADTPMPSTGSVRNGGNPAEITDSSSQGKVASADAPQAAVPPTVAGTTPAPSTTPAAQTQQVAYLDGPLVNLPPRAEARVDLPTGQLAQQVVVPDDVLEQDPFSVQPKARQSSQLSEPPLPASNNQGTPRTAPAISKSLQEQIDQVRKRLENSPFAEAAAQFDAQVEAAKQSQQAPDGTTPSPIGQPTLAPTPSSPAPAATAPPSGNAPASTSNQVPGNSPSPTTPINPVPPSSTFQPRIEPEVQPSEAPVKTSPETLPAPGSVVPGSGPANSATGSPTSRITSVPGHDGQDQLSIFIHDKDIREVLAMLSEQGGLNILPSRSVQGLVSASLNGVTIDTALDAILRSTGFISRREGQFIYVGTPQDFTAMNTALDTIGTRVYRPNYVTAAELESLISPLLTPNGVGKVKATAPAKTRIPADGTDAEGDNFAGADAVLVQDFEAVLCAIDQVVEELDRRPAQVAIEAMILSVRLDDQDQFGVDFQFLRDKKHVRFGTGQPLQDLAQVTFDGGLKFAFLDSNLGAFLEALETIGDTNVIASPRLMVLNKHRAEILIGSQLGYVSTSQTETSTTQNVEFLEVGAQLRLRPFIAHDGMIRMEVHPELSTGTVRIEQGFTLPDKDVTQVTTNIMVRDGYTVVIGGLMREDLTTNTTQVPVVGNLPVVGFLFRKKTEQTERREILVLVTPHIMHEPEAYEQGELGAGEFHRRQSVYADKMSPLGKRSIGRKYLRLAQEALARGERKAALRLVSLAVQFDPLNRAAIDLQADLQSGTPGDHQEVSLAAPLRSPGPQPLGPEPEPLAPWMLDDLSDQPLPWQSRPPQDPGVPGHIRRLEPTGPQP